MKLRPIIRREEAAALSLLTEGFPLLAQATWRQSFARMLAYAEEEGDGVVGQIGMAGGRDIGICLALPVSRSTYMQIPRRQVNLSAFYLRPGQEWMTTLFLRRLMADDSVDYVDVTASYSMREINRRIGFQDHSAGMVVVPTAAASWRPGGAGRLLALHDTPEDALSGDMRRLLAHHDRLGCVVLVVETGGAYHPLVLAATGRKGVAGARILLARDRALIREVIGPLSRHLLGRGLFYIEYDAVAAAADLPEALFWRRSSPVQMTRAPQGEAIDLTFSEFAFIPSPKLSVAVTTWPERTTQRVLHWSATGRFSAYADPATGMALQLAEFGIV